jgi:hypothetical protein
MSYSLLIGPFDDHASAQQWAESHALDNYDLLEFNPCLPLRPDRSCSDQFERKYYLGCPTPE